MCSRLILLLSCGVVLMAGCALHSPDKVLYGTFDYNTERHLSAQVESYDHLPLKPVRVKLMRFGYNVGPLPSGTGTLGWGTRHSFSGSDYGECEPGLMMDGYMSPTPIVPMAPAVESAIPPAPPAQDSAATSRASVRMAGHQTERLNRGANAAWLFSPPAVR